MVAERKGRRRGAASVLPFALPAGLAIAAGAALGACSGETPPQPRGNTGPGTTVARIEIAAVRTVLAVGDSAYFSGRAYDNAGMELPVAFQWRSNNPGTLTIDPSTGRGLAQALGRAGVSASVGSAHSNVLYIFVNP